MDCILNLLQFCCTTSGYYSVSYTAWQRHTPTALVAHVRCAYRHVLQAVVLLSVRAAVAVCLLHCWHATSPTCASRTNHSTLILPCVACSGKLQNSVNIPSELQQQLQHAQQQNQTLARILAKECAQAAAHVENQQQLQAVWHQLITAQHLPVNATLQVMPCWVRHSGLSLCPCRVF